MLHPYYKLDYIKMAWGGPKEQEAERANGNPNAKDWHDEVHKLVEKTMEDYWDDGCSTPAAAVPHTNTVTAGDDVFPNENTLQSDYDRLRRELIQQIVHDNGGGRKVELRRYLGDRPPDVSRDTDIIEWWAVSAAYSYLDLLHDNGCYLGSCL